MLALSSFEPEPPYTEKVATVTLLGRQTHTLTVKFNDGSLDTMSFPSPPGEDCVDCNGVLISVGDRVRRVHPNGDQAFEVTRIFFLGLADSEDAENYPNEPGFMLNIRNTEGLITECFADVCAKVDSAQDVA